MSNEKPPRAPRLPSATDSSVEAVSKRRALLAEAGLSSEQLAGSGPEIEAPALAGSIEGFLGFARVPVGVFGPLRLAGDEARGDYFVPVATSEGALVASYQHVANVVQRTDGIVTRCTQHRVWRAPVFIFKNLEQADAFARWLPSRFESLAEVTADGSRHGRLQEVLPSVVGREVYVRLGFTTGDAAGQNMVTLATGAICTRLLDDMTTKPEYWQLESNFSGDKKATSLVMPSARGRRVSAELTLPAKLCKRYFRSGPLALARAWDIACAGAALSGTVGAQGNYANALAGLFLACGQDVACVSEAVTGLSRVEARGDEELYFSVTLPNMIVGTVGGGTYLPTAAESLAMLDCQGNGKAARFAEICAAVVLAGELALTGALAGGSFAHAHATMGRGPASEAQDGSGSSAPTGA